MSILTEPQPQQNEVHERPLILPIIGEVERLVRAHGTMFLVTDRQGDIAPSGARELGLFFEDTRYLSHYALAVSDGQIVRLSAEASHPAYNQIDLMVSAPEECAFLDDPKNFLHIRRRQILDGGLTEQIVFTNFLRRATTLDVRISFEADFADIFEVRGAIRSKRGRYRPGRVDGSTVTLAYEGLCGALFQTTIAFARPPSELAAGVATYEIAIAPDEEVVLEVRVLPGRDGTSRSIPGMAFSRRAERASHEAEAFRASSTRWSCESGPLQSVLDQSVADLHAMRLRFGDQTIVGAGIPWFFAPFGRDALITSYETLTMNPDLARESLRALAAYQGKKYDDRSEEEPGKIFHELRFGEMSRTGEIPHSPYYGSIDATPLFVIVADAVYKFTGDVAFLREMKPAVVAALRWIDVRSAEGTQLVTYERKTPSGLVNQGWKDSRAGVSFPNGRHAEPPIALCEVQGYCIDAYARGARILRALGDEELAAACDARSDSLRAVFEARFWMPHARRHAYAIDGKGRILPTIVSNIGHLLWSRAIPREKAAEAAHVLLASSMFSGYGVRTLAADQPVYNPLSYHNGTVWPHDNALIAKGLANYDLHDAVARVFNGIYEAMAHFRERRLPELYCGIARRTGPVVRYPVAGSPQAWAAGAPFLLLQAMLGIRADAPHGRLVVRNPQLPNGVRRLDIDAMRVGNALVSMRFRRVGARCHVDRLDITGPLKTSIEID